MQLYVKITLLVVCLFMFCISFLITRFDATHVQIYDVADRFDKQPQISDQNVWDRSNRNGGPTRGVKHYEKSTITNLERPSRILRTAIAFNNFSDDVLLYSSFIDYRNGNMDYPCVRMIILKRISASVQLSCRFDEELVEGTFYELAENHLQRYGTYIISCKIPKRLNIDDVNEWILTDGINSANIRAIYRIPKEQSIRSYQFDYGICVPFLFGTTYSGQRLVEFVELNKLLGAQRIIIYTHKRSLARDLQDALVYYSAQRLIELVEYEPAVLDVWYHGQLITITDCLYRDDLNVLFFRNMGVIRYLAFHDLDEFIIPVARHNLVTLFYDIFTSAIASYRIPTRYFRIEKDVPITLNNKKSRKRLDSLLTKCVVRPEMIFEQGVHHTSRVIQDRYKCETLPSAYATLHHYKKDIITGKTFNNGIERFRQQLNESFQSALHQIGL